MKHVNKIGFCSIILTTWEVISELKVLFFALIFQQTGDLPWKLKAV